MPAPIGNKNAAKAKIWSAAVERALAEKSRIKGKIMLDECARALVDKAAEGDVAALRELGDRLEGKPVQAISGVDGGPVIVEVVRFAGTPAGE